MAARPFDPRVDALLGRAEQAARDGRAADAASLYAEVLRLATDHPVALNALGNRALVDGDVRAARDLLGRATQADPMAPSLWLNLAVALRANGDDDAEIAALERALALDPYFLLALLEKARWFERHGDEDGAVRCYRGLIAAAPPADTLPPAFREAIEHGRARMAAADDALYARIHAELGDGEAGSERMRHAIDAMTGRRKIYVQQPVGLNIPYLPAIQFFDRSLFPWFEQLEAATDMLRAAFLTLAEAGDETEQPYVQIAAGQPVNQWQTLNNSLSWGARFLWKNGIEATDVTATCPEAAALMRSLPLLDIPARGPTVMMSTLQPGAHIPPHHGVTNLRAVVHLPLIVPEGCRFRVGSETRTWRVGEAWAFDDTIEHEAWNDSNQPRVILIIDAWNPLLSKAERDALRRTHRALTHVGGATE